MNVNSSGRQFLTTPGIRALAVLGLGLLVVIALLYVVVPGGRGPRRDLDQALLGPTDLAAGGAAARGALVRVLHDLLSGRVRLSSGADRLAGELPDHDGRCCRDPPARHRRRRRNRADRVGSAAARAEPSSGRRRDGFVLCAPVRHLHGRARSLRPRPLLGSPLRLGAARPHARPGDLRSDRDRHGPGDRGSFRRPRGRRSQGSPDKAPTPGPLARLSLRFRRLSPPASRVALACCVRPVSACLGPLDGGDSTSLCSGLRCTRSAARRRPP